MCILKNHEGGQLRLRTLPFRIVPPGLLLGRVFKKLYFGATVSGRAMEICQIHLFVLEDLAIIPPWACIRQVRVVSFKYWCITTPYLLTYMQVFLFEVVTR